MEPSLEEVHAFLSTVNSVFEEYTGTTDYNLSDFSGRQYYELYKKAGELMRFDGADDVDPILLKREFNEFFGIIRKMDVRFQRPDSKHPMNYIIDVVRARLDPPSKESTLSSTKFLVYRDAALELARKVRDANKTAEVRKLYKEIPKNEMKHMMNHARYLVEKLHILEEQNSRITDRVLRLYENLYFDICGHLEKIIILLIGIKTVLDGRSSTYEELRKKYKHFGSNVKLLCSQPLFNTMIAPVEPIIRNAVAHPSVSVIPSRELVTFDDGSEKSVTYSFSDFVQKTRELASAMFVMSHVDSAVLLPDLERFRDFIRS